jgi:ferrous iron transport protein B
MQSAPKPSGTAREPGAPGLRREIRIALAGNPNAGKTTLFNALTGAQQQVGNWPGVTVERREGRFDCLGHPVTVVDLPGIYSLTAYSLDEHVAHNYLLDEQPDAVVAVVDASNLERHLFLVVQLLELGARVIVALNMMDVAEAQGVRIDQSALARILGVTVVPMVASRGEGRETLLQAIHDAAKLPASRDRELRVDYGPDVEAELARMVRRLEPLRAHLNVGPRWLALRLLEGEMDELHHVESLPGGDAVAKALALSRDRLMQVLGKETGLEVIERRYAFLRGLMRECQQQPGPEAERLSRSDRIDRVLTNRWLGVPIFLLAMGLMFQLVFLLSAPVSRGISRLVAEAGRLAQGALAWAPGWVGSLLADGVLNGVGSVLVFLPSIVLLFLVLALLEDSGYMARAALVSDRLMHGLGLHGRSLIPMIIGFGCNVPAVMAARTLETRRDRILTILINPLMSCSGRLPVYTLFAAAFFARYQGLVVFSIYLLGILLAVAMAQVLGRLLFREGSAPLVIELPHYQVPTARNVWRYLRIRTWAFVSRAGTLIALASVGLWLLARLPWGVEYAARDSLVGRIGELIAPVFRPAGFAHWQAGVALLLGVFAKELVVGTLGTLAGSGTGGLAAYLPTLFTPLSAYAFMAMTLAYIPCAATLVAIRREVGGRWMLVAVGYSLLLGWVIAVLVFQVGRLLGFR